MPILGIQGIEESSVYQDIFAKGEAESEAKGRVEEARRCLLLLGYKRLSPPDEWIEAAIASLTDLDRLRELLERVVYASTWDEVLDEEDL